MPNKSGKIAPLRSITGLMLGALLGFVCVWIASQLFGEELARRQTDSHARNLHQQVTQSLTHGLNAFVRQRAEIADRAFLQRFVRGGNVAGITFFNHQGRAFWSTDSGRNGTRLESELLKKLLAGRTPIAIPKTTSAFTVSHLIRWLPFAANNSQATLGITAVMTPVINEGQVIGATELLIDSTGFTGLIGSRMNLAALLIGGLLTAIVLLAGYLTTRYARARLDSTKANALAHDARRSEAEAREMADQLGERNEFVGQLNRLLEVNLKQLGDAQDALVRKNRLAQMGQLTATVAHEIRNPLSALRNALFIIRKMSTDSEPIKRHLDIADRSIARCDKFIAELLDFTRIDQLSRQTLNFDDWVMTIVENQAEHLPETVAINCELSAGDLDANFDPDRMLRVLINMMSNASEAMVGKNDDPQDPIVENPMIKISSQKTSRGVELKVRDIGPGMDEEQLDKIFEPLYSTKNFGIGLGVPAMQQILQQHGGGLEYKSQVGKGTTATAWFPLDFADTVQTEPASVPEKFLVPDAAKSA